MAGRDKLILGVILPIAIAIPGVILANLALIWLVCWPFRFQFSDRRKWGGSLFKLVGVLCVVTFDLLIGYAFGKAH